MNYIISKTNAKIVVSSTWRYDYSVSELQNLLSEWGCIGEVIDKTSPYNRGRRRESEINEWIENNDKYDLVSYVIIDDETMGDKNMCLHPHILDNSVKVLNKSDWKSKTTNWRGLTKKQAKKAVYILEKNGI